jgi:hypothetical protein
MTILRLQETGRLQMLYNKWWRNAGSCASDDKSKEKKAHSLGVANVGGIFFVLAVGLALAVVVGVVEFVWNAVTGPRVKKLSLEVSTYSFEPIYKNPDVILDVVKLQV